MKIQGDDFILTSVTPYSYSFDVELLQIVNKGKKNERSEFKNVAYGVHLQHALKMIVMYRLNKKQDVYDLKEFMKMFEKELNELRELCHEKDN